MSKGQYLLCNGACQTLPDYLILRYLVSKQLKAHGPRLKQTHMLKLFLSTAQQLYFDLDLSPEIFLYVISFIFIFLFLRVLIYLCVQKSNVTFWSLSNSSSLHLSRQIRALRPCVSAPHVFPGTL